MSDGVRLDKWLWAARFYKTRSLAAAAVGNGKIELGGHRPKPSRPVRIGDHLVIRKDPYEFEVEVTGLAEKRGSATVAAGLYAETEASAKKRVDVAAALKADRAVTPEYGGRGRPTKKDRRDLIKIKRFP